MDLIGLVHRLEKILNENGNMEVLCRDDQGELATVEEESISKGEDKHGKYILIGEMRYGGC